MIVGRALAISSDLFSNVSVGDFPDLVPTFYLSKELLAAAARTDLPTDIFMDALPFPFPASVFMLPKATIRHPTESECPTLARTRRTGCIAIIEKLDEYSGHFFWRKIAKDHSRSKRGAFP
jgi:hypothetical protein